MTWMTFALVMLAAVGLLAWIRRSKRAEAPTPPAPTPLNPATKQMLGLVTPGDQQFKVSLRDWNAMKLAAWRSRTGWQIAVRSATDIVDRCAHAAGCPGEESETEPCLPGCPDREKRMSALVVLGAARQFAPVDARQMTNAPYFAPSRERYSEVLAELSACQAELEALGFKTRPMPPPNVQTPNLKPEPVQIPETLE